MDQSTRRRVLALCASGVVLSIAGCLDDIDVDDTGAGGDDGRTDDGDGVETDNRADGGPSDDDGEDANDDGAEADDGTDGQRDDEPAIGDVYDVGDRFLIEFEFDERDRDDGIAEESMSGTQRLYDGDVHLHLKIDGEEFLETYAIGDTTYTIFPEYEDYEEECHISDREPEDGEMFEGDLEEGDDLEDAVFVEETTLDGEPVYVYETPGEEYDRLYLHRDTGYPVRIEGEDGWMEYHSWGDVDPIEPPGGACEEARD